MEQGSEGVQHEGRPVSAELLLHGVFYDTTTTTICTTLISIITKPL